MRCGGKFGEVGPVFLRSLCYGVYGAFYIRLGRQEDIMFGHHDSGSCTPRFTSCEIPETEEGGTRDAELRGGGNGKR